MNIKIVLFILVTGVLFSSKVNSEDKNEISAKETKEWISLHLKESPKLTVIEHRKPNFTEYWYSQVIKSSELPSGEVTGKEERDCEIYFFNDTFTLYKGKLINEENFPDQYESLQLEALDGLWSKIIRLQFPNDFELKITKESSDEVQIKGYHLSINTSDRGIDWYHAKSLDSQYFIFEPIISASFSFRDRTDAERMRDSLLHMQELCLKFENQVRNRF